MISAYDIAVIGAGIAGLTSAALLKQQGHNVIIFEKYPAPAPALGAGLVLQHAGLAVLAHLGIDKEAIAQGSIINRFLGKTACGKTVYDLRHEKLGSHFFSLGIHRGSILGLLHEKAMSLNIPVISSFDSAGVESSNGKHAVIAGDGQRLGGFDLVIDASGTHSVLRNKFAKIKTSRCFTHGVLWGICGDTGDLPANILQQRFYKAKSGIGLIPIGRIPGRGSKNHTALHWSIRHADFDEWKNAPLERWKAEVSQLFKGAVNYAAQFADHGEFTFADYHDIALKKYYAGRIAFIGDACHSVSPRLGQGANLGLVDALVLSRQLQISPTIDAALESYDIVRKRPVVFYHRASQLMHGLFQSEYNSVAITRDALFRAMCAVPYTHRQMLTAMAGLKTGLFTALDPATLHPDYALAK